MPFCTKCGAQLEQDNKFCHKCGARAAHNKDGDPGASFAGVFTDTPDSTASFDPEDIARNKTMGVLSYIGILVLIPLFSASKSPYAKYHVNQGFVLFIFNVLYSAATWIILAIVPRYSYFSFFGDAVWRVSGIWTILNAVFSAGGLFFVALMIVGIVNAATGKAKQLPLLGKIKIFK